MRRRRRQVAASAEDGRQPLILQDLRLCPVLRKRVPRGKEVDEGAIHGILVMILSLERDNRCARELNQRRPRMADDCPSVRGVYCLVWGPVDISSLSKGSRMGMRRIRACKQLVAPMPE